MSSISVVGSVFDAWTKYEKGQNVPVLEAIVSCNGVYVNAAEDGSFSIPIPTTILSGGGTIVTARALDCVTIGKLVTMENASEPLYFWLWPSTRYGMGRCSGQW